MSRAPTVSIKLIYLKLGMHRIIMGLVYNQKAAALFLRHWRAFFIFPGQNTRRPQINVFFQ